MFRLHPLNEEQKAEVIIGQLKGAVLQEVRSWSDEERKTADGILNKLAGIFNLQTIADLKGCLYARKQQPHESLQEFALGLQEAMRAIQARDPREAEEADETMINLLIEGARGETTRAQLRMCRRQNPVCTFSEFKEAMMDILDLNQNTDVEYGTVPGPLESEVHGDSQLSPMALFPEELPCNSHMLGKTKWGCRPRDDERVKKKYGWKRLKLNARDGTGIKVEKDDSGGMCHGNRGDAPQTNLMPKEDLYTGCANRVATSRGSVPMSL
ncbi:uncharacterized protein LOC134932358 [Pseudophryne corroboree]|uniref:uncharacterized protein LOC134932358 n=1 Tax=Pseudophryne corroboree TaxID=495146 RepID=UPI003081C412